MPKAMHDKLEREAKQKGLSGARKDRYVFGTLAKLEKAKGGGGKRKKKQY